MISFIVGFYGIHNIIKSKNGCLRYFTSCYFITYPIAFVVFAAFTPVFLIIGPLVIGILSVREIFNKYSYYSGYCLLCLIAGICMYPIAFVSAILGVISLHCAGWVLLMKKMRIAIKRCFDANYMIPKSSYAKKTIF